MNEYDAYLNKLLSTPLEIPKYDGFFRDSKIALYYFTRIAGQTHRMANVRWGGIDVKDEGNAQSYSDSIFLYKSGSGCAHVTCHEDDEEKLLYYRDSLILDESMVNITVSSRCFSS